MGEEIPPLFFNWSRIMWSDFPCKIHPKKPGLHGYIEVGSRPNRTYAHRVALAKKLNRPIREGYQACHHCDVKNCVEPEHIFEGTFQENIDDAWNKGRMNSWGAKERAKQTHCMHGHEFTPSNTYIRPNGSRACNECHRLRQRVINACRSHQQI